MSEQELGHAVALIALHSIAEAFEREAEAERQEEERQRKAEEAEERREHREAVAERRRQAMARLGQSLRLEFWRVVGWTLLSLLALTIASLSLTFSPPHADTGDAIAAAFSYLWRPLLIAAGAAWLAGLVYDLASAARGGEGWSSPLLPAHTIMGIAAPAVLIGASVDSDYVPPQVWSLVPYFSAAGFAASLVARYLWYLPGRPEAPRFAGVALCVAVVGAAGIASTLDFLPTEKAEARAAVKLRRQVSMGNCATVPASALPSGLLRNSVDGMMRCRAGGKTGKFYAFSSPALFNLFVSQRAGSVEARAERGSAEFCASGGGAYSSEWWDGSNEDNKAGRLFCYGQGRGSTIEWSDKRVDVYLTVRGRSRQVLYRWWRQNG